MVSFQEDYGLQAVDEDDDAEDSSNDDEVDSGESDSEDELDFNLDKTNTSN